MKEEKKQSKVSLGSVDKEEKRRRVLEIRENKNGRKNLLHLQ